MTDTNPPHYEGHRGRLRERFQATGGVALQDYELLEMLLFAIYPRKDVKPLAKSLIQKFGSFASVFHAPMENLMDCPGIGLTAAAFLKGIKETAIRLSRSEIIHKNAFESWQQIIDYCRLQCGYERVEQFRVLFLDKKNNLIADEQQQKGTVDHASVYPREIVKRALEIGATGIILLHNHPSGDPTPSASDIDMTLKVMDAARHLGITVHDHIILTTSNHASLKTLGLV
jgi:DNA repair protein RadC